MKWDSDIAQVKREEAKNAIEIAAQTMKDLAASVGIKDLNVGVGGKTKDVKSFVFDTLKLPAAAWSDKTKDPSLDSNALMDMEKYDDFYRSCFKYTTPTGTVMVP